MSVASPAPAAPRQIPRPEQAIAARRRAAESKTTSVGKAIKTLTRTGAPVTCAGVARLAGVSRSFIYENDQARAMVTAAQTRTQARTAGPVPAATTQQEASWRERALNAEQRARDLHHELTAQRHLTAGLLGQLRHPDGTWLADENNQLRQQNERLLAERNQLARERNDLHRKLDAARANLARLAEQRVTTLFPHGPGQAAAARAHDNTQASPSRLTTSTRTSGDLPAAHPRNDTSPTCRRHIKRALSCANTIMTICARRKVDEAHGYKNLRTFSNIPEASIDGSMRASDLDMKIRYLRERNGSRVVTFATATPIANSITEAYVMQHYLRPDLLEAAGIEDFDTWAATFAQTVTQIEMAPEAGSSFRQKTRFAKFVNVPEMMRMWHVSADIKTGDDLGLPTPDLARRESDGQRMPEIVLIQPSKTLLDYVAELGERAEAVRRRAVAPEEDNMLKVSSDGRKAALDLRLVGLPMTEPGKIDIAASRIAAIWREHRDDIYRAADGSDSPVRGSLQLVFCDLGTPAERWNVYDELRGQLVARGVPGLAVRFIHDARTDREKGELFAACRAGTVAVLIGSTEKMGVGTNVQRRAVALHHLDCPWRPADIAQREGRILRQGNLNAEVRILRYVTERSFDAYLFQAVERKARFIAQVMRGRLDVREIEDIGDAALSYNEVKALAAGNPLLMEKAEADAELTRLHRAERAYHRNHDALRYRVKSIEHRIAELAALGSTTQDAITRRVETRGESFTITIGDRRYDKRHDAGQRLRQLLDRQMAAISGDGWPGPLTERCGQLGGFEVTGTARRVLGTPEVTIALDGVPDSEVRLGHSELQDIDPGRLIVRMENRLHSLESIQVKTSSEIERLKAEATRATEDLAKPFPLSEQLADARSRLAQIEQLLEEAARQPKQGDHEPSPKGAPDHGGDTTDRAKASGHVGVAVRGGAPEAVAVASRGFPAGQPVAAGKGGSATAPRLPAGTGLGAPTLR